MPDSQVRCWQVVSWPGQSLGEMQPTHWAAPSQIRAAPQGVPRGSARCEGTPAVQRSVVQGLASSGMSVSSGSVVMPPLPSHTASWQSAGVWSASGSEVPAGALVRPQVPAMQVRCWQGMSVSGQSAGVLHAEPPTPEEVVSPMVPLVVVPAPPLEWPASEMSTTTEVQPKGAPTNRADSPATAQSRMESLSPPCTLGRITVSVNQNFAANESSWQRQEALQSCSPLVREPPLTA